MNNSNLIRAIFLGIGITLLLDSCKKESAELTTVNFHLTNPITGETYAGVKVRVTERKEIRPNAVSLDTKYKYEIIWEGITDEEGKATHTFKTYEHFKWSYWESVDKEGFLDNKSIYTRPILEALTKNKTNNANYKVGEYIQMLTWIKNINCLSQNDQMQWRKRNLTSYGSNYSEWRATSLGCYDNISAITTNPQDIWEIEIYVNRNGVTATIIDTVYLSGQNGIDTLKLFY